MRWPWHQEPEPRPPEDQAADGQADVAERHDAEQRLRDAVRAAGRADRVARRARWTREQNHFSELISDLIRSVRP